MSVSKLINVAATPGGNEILWLPSLGKWQLKSDRASTCPASTNDLWNRDTDFVRS